MRKVNFIYQSFVIRATTFLRLRMNLPKVSRLTKKLPRHVPVLFFLATKRGSRPSESPRRFRNPRTHGHRPVIYIHTHMHVRTCHIPRRRFGTSDGVEKLSKAKLTWPARRTLLSRLPQLCARRMCFQHTIVNTFYLFVYTELLLSVYRWNRATPDLLSAALRAEGIQKGL